MQSMYFIPNLPAAGTEPAILGPRPLGLSRHLDPSLSLETEGTTALARQHLRATLSVSPPSRAQGGGGF